MKRLLLSLIVIAVCIGFGVSGPPPGGAGGGSRSIRSNPPSDVPGPAGFPSGATHYWTLDEASGTRNDSVGTTHLSETTAVGAAAGKDNNGANYTWNTTDFGVLDGTADIAVPSAYSLCGWFKFSAVDANQTLSISAITTPGAITISLVYTADGDLISFAHNEEETLSHSIIPDTSWHFICATATGATAIIYLDGASVESNPAATLDFDDWNSLRISAANSSAMSGTVGLVDEIVFFPLALTPQNVTDIWNGGTGLFGP